MNPTKEPADTEQQSYFYVVWPEDKSPSVSRAATATKLCSTTASSTASPGPVTLPTLNYESHALPGSSSSGSSSSSTQQQQSPVGSPLSKETVRRPTASVQVTASHNNIYDPQDNYTKINSDCGDTSTKSQYIQHATATIPTSSTTIVLPALETPNITSTSHGRHRTVLPPEVSHNRVRYHQINSTGDSNLREIGVLAKQAIINLRKIVIATTGSGLNSVSAVNNFATSSNTEDIPPAKRICVWDQSSAGNCMECEVKDAEINILRRRIQSMQEQIEQILLPNGNNLVRSQISPPPEDSISHIKPNLGQTQEIPQLNEHHHQNLILQQQHRGKNSSKAATVILQSDSQQSGQTSSGTTTSKQSGDFVELVGGSGIYLPAYKLEEATRDAKTGTQLARKLMDAFWDKDTLARSTLTPRSKFQYQQLDPKVIKSIEAYCLSHDSTLHSKDIHATMTDKCCQARSRYRTMTPQMYSSD